MPHLTLSSIWKRLTSLMCAVGLSLSGTAAEALTFTFNAAPGTPSSVVNGFAAAGDIWSAVLADDVTVNINISFTNLGDGILGGTVARRYPVSYNLVRALMYGDITSIDDWVAFSNLLPEPYFNLLINQTSNSRGGSSEIPYLDINGSNNNTQVHLIGANAKALGLAAYLPVNHVDATIQFSNLFNWDFDRSNGIDPLAFDFIGVAAHEIGHALGFVSGVDLLDSVAGIIGPILPDNFYRATVMDLFRFSEESAARSRQIGAPVIDFTASPTPKYFSIDAGRTLLSPFSTGTYLGDGEQASHWQDNLGIGMMDPTIDYGELLQITANDLKVFDVMGWDLVANNPSRRSPVNLVLAANSFKSKPVPEPSLALGLMALGLGFSIANPLKGRRYR
ncbi:MAG: PEP-CTERM sorting domain-containing protein [Desertifilum sp. SIO1I2]|nr:PEP-CTERM sorting domain-containing protein [Desertifilum sp. SIO1I2]